MTIILDYDAIGMEQLFQTRQMRHSHESAARYVYR